MTLPSSQCASATFSLVASAWTSTTITCACSRASSTRSSISSNIDDRRREEERAEHVDHGDRRPVGRRPDGQPAARAPSASSSPAGSPARSVARYGPISERRQVWLPSVITSAPGGEEALGELGRDPDAVGRVLAVEDAERRRRAPRLQPRQPLLDRPPAGRADDVSDEEDLQRNRRAARRRAHRQRHVVAGVLGVARERLALDARSGRRSTPTFERAFCDARADGQRRVGAEVRQRDDDGRGVERPDVDPGAVRPVRERRSP